VAWARRELSSRLDSLLGRGWGRPLGRKRSELLSAAGPYVTAVSGPAGLHCPHASEAELLGGSACFEWAAGHSFPCRAKELQSL
jgi:hypothetical protein